MKSLYPTLPAGLTDALGTALFHSLWQAAAAGLVLLVCIALIPRRYAQVRYLAGVISILAMVLLPAATFFISYPYTATPVTVVSVVNPVSLHTPLTAAAATTATPDHTLSEQVMSWFRSNQDLLVMLWFAGLTLFTLRFAGGYLLSRRLRRRGLTPAPESWQRQLDQMARHMRVGQPVKLFTSTRITVPMVMGFLKPMILFPAGMLGGLTPDQVELILAHELAHVRRYDYLVNFLLTLAQMLLFFHPAMWLAAKFVRDERENCCDAVALRYHPDPSRYARTLLTLETYRQKGAVLSAAGGSLSNRIGRILNLKGKPNPVHYATAIVLGFALVVSVMASAYKDTPIWNTLTGNDETGNVTLDNVVITPEGDDTGIKDEYVYVKTDSEEVVITILRDGEKTEIHMRDGAVVNVKVNDKDIPADQYPEYQEMAMQSMRNTGTHQIPAIPGMPAIPAVPAVPGHVEGESQEAFERRMEAWEDEMRVWESEMEKWEETATQGATPGEGEEWEKLGRAMEKLGTGLEQTLGNEERWEEFGLHMEKMGEELARSLEHLGGLNHEMSEEEQEAHEKTMEKFGKDMEEWGERFGKDMEKWAEQYAHEAEAMAEGITAERDAAAARKDELTAERDRITAERDEMAADAEESEDPEARISWSTTGVDRLTDMLMDDGLITSRDHFTFRITDKGLWVDGKKLDGGTHDYYLSRISDLFDYNKEVNIVRKGGSTSIQVN
jgi:beta-lactamase regulating signal transducer with metallopeptidase domain